MHSIVKFVLCLMLATIIKAERNNKIDVQNEQALVKFLIDSRSFDVDPEVRMSCFDEFSPILANLTNSWQSSHRMCVASAENARYDLDKSTSDDRIRIQGKTDSSCNAFAACKQNKHSMEYFNCTKLASKSGESEMYWASTVSEDIIARIKVKSIEIDQKEQSCTVYAERTYHDQQNRIYQQMTECLSRR